VRANQAGNGNYQAATQVQQSVAVAAAAAAAAQTISFTSAAPAGATVGGSTYAVSATASSGLAVSFSSGSPAVCTVSGSTVSFAGAGTCIVRANQAGNGSYQAAPELQQSFAVGPGAQTIAFTSTAPAGATVGASSYAVSATASSGLAVSFSSGSAGVCTLSGATVSFVGAGTCSVRANQAGNGNYQAAPQLQQAFAVAAASSPQTISFTSAAPGAAVMGGPAYTVTATATSGLAVVFGAATPAVCTVSGSTVSLVAAGTCTLTANQAGNSSYQAAAQLQQSFAVGRGSQTITITSDAGAVDKNTPPYTITAVATSGLAVTFTSDAESAGVCSLSGSTVTFDGSRGECIINANQAGDANYLAAPQVVQSFKVKNHTSGGDD
jgi:hypothetical protein